LFKYLSADVKCCRRELKKKDYAFFCMYCRLPYPVLVESNTPILKLFFRASIKKESERGLERGREKEGTMDVTSGNPVFVTSA